MLTDTFLGLDMHKTPFILVPCSLQRYMCFLLTQSYLGISALKIRTTSLNIHKLAFFYEALWLLLSIKLVIISKYIYNSQQKFGATSSSV